MTIILVGLVAIGGVGAYYLMQKRGEEDIAEAAPEVPSVTPTPMPQPPEDLEFIGPYDDCSRKQKCNCAACCVKADCHKKKRSRKCPCDQVLRGIRQRQTRALEAEEEIYSYYSSVDKEVPVIIA